MAIGKVMVFTDASRREDAERSAFAWLAMDMMVENTNFFVSHIEEMVFNKKSSIHAEACAIFSAANHYCEAEEVHIFTDSLFVVQQVNKIRKGYEIRTQVYRDELFALSAMKNVHLYHIRAHKSYFYNEVVDKASRFVAFGEMSIEEAKNWMRQTCREGYLEIRLTKKMEFKPKRVFARNEKNQALRIAAMATLF